MGICLPWIPAGCLSKPRILHAKVWIQQSSIFQLRVISALNPKWALPSTSPDQSPARLTVWVKPSPPRAKQERGKGCAQERKKLIHPQPCGCNSENVKGPQVSLLYCPMFPRLCTHFSFLPCTFHCCRILQVEFSTTVNWPRSVLHQFTLGSNQILCCFGDFLHLQLSMLCKEHAI